MQNTYRPWLTTVLSGMLSVCATPSEHTVPLGVIIMVKNDQDAITTMLAPFAVGPVQHVLIYDTGSEDETVSCAQHWLQSNAITYGAVLAEPFLDYAASRNKALAHAEQTFPEVALWLMLDSEWIVRGLPELYQFCADELESCSRSHDGPQSYLITIKDNAIEYKAQRLIKAHAHARFFGALHEVIVHPSNACVPNTVHITMCSNEASLRRLKQRCQANAAQLKQEYCKNKYNPRTIFALAQALEHLEKLPEAQKMYLKRAQMGDPYAEETWYALYKAACVTEQLAQSTDSGFSWDDAFKHYRNSFVMRPKRAEPLIRIAMHCARVKEYEAAYSYAIRARDIPIPTDERLPLERELYASICDWILSACALEVEDYRTGYQALQRIIQHQPNNNVLQQSLKRYMELLQL